MASVQDDEYNKKIKRNIERRQEAAAKRFDFSVSGEMVIEIISIALVMAAVGVAATVERIDISILLVLVAIWLAL